jgi:hypothetical protein
MKMQDKEFDDLFRLKLEDFEAMPSGKVWQNIDAELGESKRKKITVMSFLSVAASTIVLVTAGVLFVQHKIGTTKQPVKMVIAKTKQLLNKPVLTNVVAAQRHQPLKSSVALINPTISLQQQVAKNKMISPKQKQSQVVEKGEVVKAEQPVLEADQPPVVVEQQDGADTAKLIAAMPALKQTDKPILAVVNADKLNAASPVKRHRIRGLGDVLNVVIATVDKRKDKVIEFSDDDEGSITGVNLGFIKIKKDN